MRVPVLLLSLLMGWTSSSPFTTKPHYAQPTTNSSVVRPGARTEESNTLRCDEPYNIEDASEPGKHLVNIVRGGTVLHTIQLPTQVERNGFALNWAKKTKVGFEIDIEYGSVIYYNKRFIFICRQHRFYLSTIIVESFNKHDPAKSTRKVIRLKPNLPVEKFAITDFMR